MNALSLIPGIGTTLQLWRLLQNVIVIMSKSVTTMAGVKETGGEMKEEFQKIKGDLEKMADPAALANAAANKAADIAKSQVSGAVANQAAALTAANPMAALTSGGGVAANPMAALTSGGVANPMASLTSGGVGGAMDALKSAGGVGGAMDAFKSAGGVEGNMKGGGAPRKTNHLRSIKKYKREYKQSIREIRKTRKNILRCIKNMI